MKFTLSVIAILVASLFYFGGSLGWCEENMHMGHEHEMTPEQHAQAQNVGNKICPVMGGPIKEGSEVKYEHEGKVYNFCCAMCVESFKKDPHNYIKKVQEELASRSVQQLQ